jgi:MATE family, multidrug efflux pump
MDEPMKLLPGLCLSSSGRPRLDTKAVATLAFPYMLNSAVQAVLNATDTWFIGRLSPAAPQAAEVATRACGLLWIAAGYQLFDGLNIGSSACLRGAGDVRLPAMMVLALSWLLFVPLAHSLSFAPGTGWVNWLPQFGMGALGGWLAALTYVCCLGLALFLRWWSGAWQRIALPLT